MNFQMCLQAYACCVFMCVCFVVNALAIHPRLFIKRSNSWLVAISVLRFSEVGRLLTWLLATQSQTRSRFPSSFPLRTGLGVLNTLFSFFNEKKTYGTSILISITYLINRYFYAYNNYYEAPKLNYKFFTE